jgi:hypothetical protein
MQVAQQQREPCPYAGRQGAVSGQPWQQPQQIRQQPQRLAQ